MPKTQVDSLIHVVRRSVLSQDGMGTSDAELLGHFIDRRDVSAFELLVRRHGPLVMGVCHRILRHQQDAEDAFQAAFLVLACKASSVRPRTMVANWLHGVAYRSALKARTMRTKKQSRERQVREMPEPESLQKASLTELRQLIDQELNGLAAIYRLPILLCDLDGKSIKEATQQLGWRQGTLASRLARGRKMLAKRLAKRGIALSAASLVTIALTDAASAGITESLIHSTVTSARLIIAGSAAIQGVASAKIAALAEGVMKTMQFSKFKVLSIVVFITAIMFGGSALIPTTSNAGQAESPVQKPAVSDEAAADNPTTPTQSKSDDRLSKPEPQDESAKTAGRLDYKAFVTKYLRTWPTDRKLELVLFFTGQQHNYEAPCGCTAPQFGGLERRYNLFAQIRGFGIPTVAMDLGDIYDAPKLRSMETMQSQAQLKYRFSMEALSIMQYSAVALGPNEFRMPLLMGLGEAVLNLKNRSYSVLCAKIDNKEEFAGMIENFRVVDPKSGTPKVGIVGTLGQSSIIEIRDPSIRFKDNGAQVLAEMNKRDPGLRVMLYEGTREEAEKLAQTTDAFDIIQYRTEDSDPPSQSERAKAAPGQKQPKAQLVTVGHKGRWIGVMGVFRDAGGNFELKWEVVSLNPDFITPPQNRPNHPIVKLLEKYTEHMKVRDFLGSFPNPTAADHRITSYQDFSERFFDVRTTRGGYCPGLEQGTRCGRGTDRQALPTNRTASACLGLSAAVAQ